MQLVPINKTKLRLELQYLILKGRSHKYIKRIPTGNQKRPYIYIYPGESKEDVLKKIGEAKQERGQDSTSKALFEKVSKEIKSIFPEADIESDYKDFNSKEKISKVEYGKIALTYFQNKEKYDEVAIKMKGLRDKKKPLGKKEKVVKEKKQLTPEQEEKRLAKNEYARKRRAIIKQLREKYNKETKQETQKETKEEPKQEQPKTEIRTPKLPKEMEKQISSFVDFGSQKINEYFQKKGLFKEFYQTSDEDLKTALSQLKFKIIDVPSKNLKSVSVIDSEGNYLDGYISVNGMNKASFNDLDHYNKFTNQIKDSGTEYKEDDFHYEQGKPDPYAKYKREGEGDDIYINVPFSDKDNAKKLGAKWDPQRRSWFLPSSTIKEEDYNKFSKWM